MPGDSQADGVVAAPTAGQSDGPQIAPGDLICVTGATGYVGGRLVRMLLDRGYRVRCVVREPRKLDRRSWSSDPRVEVAQHDLSEPERLTEILRECTAAYYLVHSMVATGAEYAEQDRALADNFAHAAAAAGVRRMVYLGGLGEMGVGLSEHLRSRREVEKRLAATGVPVTTFRAAMIIGSGSASFEILRYLVERLPAMITPRWVETECQPVAIIDVLHWLTECLAVPQTAGQVLEIGGPEVYTYRDLMQLMAKERGLSRRLIVSVPLLTPRLSSGWISLVTPVSYRIARPLAEGLRNRVVVTNDATQRLMPHDALTVREAIHRALTRTGEGEVPTHWSAAGPIPGDPDWAGGKVFIDQRSITIGADPDHVFAAVCRVGGGHGWYAGDILWRIRGWMDQVVGGPGLRRGRRHAEQIAFGEALDFWRVVGIEQGRSLKLHAEMKLPGTARLDFKMTPVGEAADRPKTELTMTARFRPKGLAGILYWYAVVPLHAFVFGGMLRGIKRAAEAMPTDGRTPEPYATSRPATSGLPTNGASPEATPPVATT
ncbi:MAG: SDR family oxidoreductase [Planctomycetota bacterium]